MLAVDAVSHFKMPLQGISMRNVMQQVWENEQGQDLIEYTLLMAFVALASAGLFITSGASISAIWSSSNAQLSGAAATASS
jgi:Flp pilus assembly pilin Flp